MAGTPLHDTHGRRAIALKAGLLVIWGLVSFVCCFFARDLQFMVAGWPFNYWMAAQGAMLVFIAILAFYAWAMNRMDDTDDAWAKVEPQAAVGDDRA